jgi:hypothetical protein
LFLSEAESKPELSENLKDEASFPPKNWNPLTAMVQADDKDLNTIQTIGILRNPEFLYGKIPQPKMNEIKLAISDSRKCREMCESWCKLAQKGNEALVTDDHLDWLKKEIDSAVREAKTVQSSETKNGGNIQDTNIQDSSKKEGNVKSLWKCLGSIFVCCRGKQDASDEDLGTEIAVNVKFLSGSIMKAKLDGSACSVSDLKQKIQAAKHIPVENQMLFIDGEKQDNDFSLEKYSDRMVYLFQRRSVLGIPEEVNIRDAGKIDPKDQQGGPAAVSDSQIEKPTDSVKSKLFEPDKFNGLYKWYPDGHAIPDVYKGEFFEGTERSQTCEMSFGFCAIQILIFVCRTVPRSWRDRVRGQKLLQVSADSDCWHACRKTSTVRCYDRLQFLIFEHTILYFIECYNQNCRFVGIYPHYC